MKPLRLLEGTFCHIQCIHLNLLIHHRCPLNRILVPVPLLVGLLIKCGRIIQWFTVPSGSQWGMTLIPSCMRPLAVYFILTNRLSDPSPPPPPPGFPQHSFHILSSMAQGVLSKYWIEDDVFRSSFLVSCTFYLSFFLPGCILAAQCGILHCIYHVIRVWKISSSEKHSWWGKFIQIRVNASTYLQVPAKYFVGK